MDPYCLQQSQQKNIPKPPVLRNQLVLHAILKKRTFLQFYLQIFRDAPIAPLSLTKNQSFVDNVNKFLQEQSKNILNCQYWKP